MHSVDLLLLAVICCSVTQSSPTLHNPLDCSISCLLALHHLPHACSNSNPLDRWCHPSIWSSIFPFFCSNLFAASESFATSWHFTSDTHNIGASASASAPPMNFQDWFPLGLTGLISLQPKGLTRVVSKIVVQKYLFLNVLTYFVTWLVKKTQI